MNAYKKSKYKVSFFKKKDLLTLKATFLVFLDQVILTSVQFLIGIALIYKTKPEEYGIFNFLMSILYFFVGLQNAIVNTPLVVLIPRMQESTKDNFKRGTFGMLMIGVFIAVAITLLLGQLSIIINPDKGLSSSQLIFFCFSLGPIMVREYWRAEAYAELQPLNALRNDTIYSLLVLIIISSTLISRTVHVSLVFAAMGFSAIAVATGVYLKPSAPFIVKTEEVKEAFHKTWRLSRWSLLGATTSWFQNSVYVYLTLALLGARQVAFLSAARLLMTPLHLLAGSWSNLFRPLVSKTLSDGNERKVIRIFLISTIILLLTLLVYSITCISALSALPATWFPPDYRGINIYIVLWAGVFFLTIIRGNLSSLFQATLAFKHLALLGSISSLLTVGLSALLITKMGIKGALFGLILGEFFLTTSLVLFLKSSTCLRLFSQVSDNYHDKN